MANVAWLSDKTFYLATYSYASGLLTPRLTTPWMTRNQIGVIIWLPLQLCLMFILTVPCIFMELALGQYSNKAIIRVWDLCPIFRGIGLCSFLTFIIYQTYHTYFCTYKLMFAILSVRSEAQWKTCNNSWNSVACYTRRDNFTRRYECGQKLSPEKCEEMEWRTSVEEFFYNRILHMNVDSKNLGPPQYELLLYTLVTIVIVFCVSSSSPKILEKILIVLAVAPGVQVLTLFAIPLTQTDGFKSLAYLLIKMQDFAKFKKLDTWMMMVQVATSGSGLGFGAYITLGARCSFRNPLHFKSILISLLVVLFTFVYTVTVQNFVLTLCLQTEMVTEDFLKLEKYLSMPEAIFFLSQANRIWITLWLSNNYLLALRSLLMMVFLDVEIFCNSLPKARKYRTFYNFFFCAIIYCGGILVSTKSGYLIIQAIDEIVLMVLPFLTGLQISAVVYFYGIISFVNDVHFMLGIRLGSYWKIAYFFIPLVLMAKFIYDVKEFYGRGDRHRSDWIYGLQQGVLWFIVASVTSYILLYLVKTVTNRNFKVCKSSKNWGPGQSDLHKSRRIFTARKIVEEYVYRLERFRPHDEDQANDQQNNFITFI